MTQFDVGLDESANATVDFRLTGRQPSGAETDLSITGANLAIAV
jgi:hypothetical protein